MDFPNVSIIILNYVVIGNTILKDKLQRKLEVY
jgi:hypothetical protein